MVDFTIITTATTNNSNNNNNNKSNLSDLFHHQTWLCFPSTQRRHTKIVTNVKSFAFGRGEGALSAGICSGSVADTGLGAGPRAHAELLPVARLVARASPPLLALRADTGPRGPVGPARGAGLAEGPPGHVASGSVGSATQPDLLRSTGARVGETCR